MVSHINDYDDDDDKRKLGAAMDKRLSKISKSLEHYRKGSPQIVLSSCQAAINILLSQLTLVDLIYNYKACYNVYYIVKTCFFGLMI